MKPYLKSWIAQLINMERITDETIVRLIGNQKIIVINETECVRREIKINYFLYVFPTPKMKTWVLKTRRSYSPKMESWENIWKIRRVSTNGESISVLWWSSIYNGDATLWITSFFDYQRRGSTLSDDARKTCRTSVGMGLPWDAYWAKSAEKTWSGIQ